MNNGKKMTRLTQCFFFLRSVVQGNHLLSVHYKKDIIRSFFKRVLTSRYFEHKQGFYVSGFSTAREVIARPVTKCPYFPL